MFALRGFGVFLFLYSWIHSTAVLAGPLLVAVDRSSLEVIETEKGHLLYPSETVPWTAKR